MIIIFITIFVKITLTKRINIILYKYKYKCIKRQEVYYYNFKINYSIIVNSIDLSIIYLILAVIYFILLILLYKSWEDGISQWGKTTIITQCNIAKSLIKIR